MNAVVRSCGFIDLAGVSAWLRSVLLSAAGGVGCIFIAETLREHCLQGAHSRSSALDAADGKAVR